MNQKRVLHLFAEPLTRKTLLRLLAGPCTRASVLFIPPELQMEANVAFQMIRLPGVDEDTLAIEKFVLGKIKKTQPLVTRGATPQGMPLMWALY